MVKKIAEFIKRRNMQKKNFIKNSNAFLPGEYTFDNSLNYIQIKDNCTSKKTAEIFVNRYNKLSHKLFVFLLKKFYFNKSFLVENNEKDRIFKGTVYLPATPNNNIINKDAKVFDFKRKQVMSLFSTEDDFLKKVDTYNEFIEFFSIPEIIMFNEEELLVKEELVEFIPIGEVSAENYSLIIESVFLSYIKYFEKCRNELEYNMINPLELSRSLSNGSLAKEFIHEHLNNNLLQKKLPTLKLHGDLWLPNLLLKNSVDFELYYIDWEHSNEFLFFYDLFWLIQSEAINNKNYTYIENYINGEYDSHFKQIFNVFNLNFQEKYRLDYLVIFFLDVFVTRLNKADENIKKVVFNQFHELLKKYK